MEVLAWFHSMLSHEFIRDAFVAGTRVALVSGVAGYFLVLRGQVFAVDALSHVAFTGALAALAVGVSELVGLFAATILVAVVLSLLATEARARDVATGSLFALVLGLGVLFLSIYVTTRSTGNGVAGVHGLFGSVFGIGPQQTVLSVVVGIAVALAVLLVSRPLLFATIDTAAAAADGVPVAALGTAFLVLVAVIAEAVPTAFSTSNRTSTAARWQVRSRTSGKEMVPTLERATEIHRPGARGRRDFSEVTPSSSEGRQRLHLRNRRSWTVRSCRSTPSPDVRGTSSRVHTGEMSTGARRPREALASAPAEDAPQPLLPGEQAQPELADDADHWCAVYEELTSFIRQAASCQPARETLRRYQLRLNYWRRVRYEANHTPTSDGKRQLSDG